MNKELTDMTLEELWLLFPIELVEPDDNWPLWFDEIQARLTDVLSTIPIKRISHIGSTAIKNIKSKNIVDVLVEIEPDNFDTHDHVSALETAAKVLESDGFIRMSTDAKRISLNLGYTKDGYAEKVYHIHLRYAGDNDELYFRDYVNDHSAIAKEYEALKLHLMQQYKHDRNAYTDAKTDFVNKWNDAAKVAYPQRY